MRITVTTLLALVLLVGSAHAALVVNGDFSSGLAGNLTWIERQNLDNGWYTPSGQWTISSGLANVTAQNMGQANTVGTESGHLVTLSFDWTPDGSATGDDLKLYYSVAGWFNDTSTNGFDDFMNLSNSNLDDNGESTYSGLTGKSDVVDLQTGTVFVKTNHTNTNVSVSSVIGTAGITKSFEVEMDMSGYAEDADDISDLKYFGVRFRGHAGISGTNTLDNVAVAVVPEPATLALTALGLLGLRRRRRR